jgi:hypothetical protein
MAEDVEEVPVSLPRRRRVPPLDPLVMNYISDRAAREGKTPEEVLRDIVRENQAYKSIFGISNIIENIVSDVDMISSGYKPEMDETGRVIRKQKVTAGDAIRAMLRGAVLLNHLANLSVATTNYLTTQIIEQQMKAFSLQSQVVNIGAPQQPEIELTPEEKTILTIRDKIYNKVLERMAEAAAESLEGKEQKKKKDLQEIMADTLEPLALWVKVQLARTLKVPGGASFEEGGTVIKRKGSGSGS